MGRASMYWEEECLFRDRIRDSGLGSGLLCGSKVHLVDVATDPRAVDVEILRRTEGLGALHAEARLNLSRRRKLLRVLDLRERAFERGDTSRRDNTSVANHGRRLLRRVGHTSGSGTIHACECYSDLHGPEGSRKVNDRRHRRRRCCSVALGRSEEPEPVLVYEHKSVAERRGHKAWVLPL